MIRRTAIVLATLTWVACTSSRPIAPHEELSGVSITFDHFGAAADPWQQRMAESGEMPEARASGSDFWLRFTNESQHVINFRTLSTYLKQPIELVEIGDKTRVIALPDGGQIAIDYGLESRRGSPIPAFGGDMFWTSNLPPHRSVLFSVPKKALDRGRRVVIDYTIAGRNDSPRYRTYFVK